MQSTSDDAYVRQYTVGHETSSEQNYSLVPRTRSALMQQATVQARARGKLGLKVHLSTL